MPVKKRPGSTVIGATLNKSGAFRYEVAALAMSGSSVLVAVNALLLKRHRLSAGPQPETVLEAA